MTVSHNYGTEFSSVGTSLRYISVNLYTNCFNLFCRHNVLEQTDGIEDAGGVRWQLALLLLFAWILVYFALFKGIKLTGKVYRSCVHTDDLIQ